MIKGLRIFSILILVFHNLLCFSQMSWRTIDLTLSEKHINYRLKVDKNSIVLIAENGRIVKYNSMGFEEDSFIVQVDSLLKVKFQIIQNNHIFINEDDVCFLDWSSLVYWHFTKNSHYKSNPIKFNNVDANGKLFFLPESHFSQSIYTNNNIITNFTSKSSGKRNLQRKNLYGLKDNNTVVIYDVTNNSVTSTFEQKNPIFLNSNLPILVNSTAINFDYIKKEVICTSPFSDTIKTYNLEGHLTKTFGKKGKNFGTGYLSVPTKKLKSMSDTVRNKYIIECSQYENTYSDENYYYRIYNREDKDTTTNLSYSSSGFTLTNNNIKKQKKIKGCIPNSLKEDRQNKMILNKKKYIQRFNKSNYELVDEVEIPLKPFYILGLLGSELIGRGEKLYNANEDPILYVIDLNLLFKNKD